MKITRGTLTPDRANRLIHVRKTVTFDGGAGTGAQGAVPIFDITGRVALIDFVGFVTTSLDGVNATISHGVDTDKTRLSAALTATALDVNFWVKNTPSAGMEESSIGTQSLYMGYVTSESIIGTVATADITAGVIEYDLWYKPITDDGALVAA